MYNVVVNILTVLIYVDVLAVLSSAHSLIFFLSLLSVSCTGLHLQPLSSTSCLCKDPATAVVSIVSVQTPWCHGIHSLLSVPPEEAGEQRTMRCHFLNPFVLFYTFFFVQLVLFFLSPPHPVLRESRPHFPQDVSFLITIQVPLSHWVFFYHHGFSQWNTDGGEHGIQMKTPFCHLMSGYLAICQ